MSGDQHFWNQPASHIESLPPWDSRRDTLRIDEVPALLKRLYGVGVSKVTVYKWVYKGLPSKRDPARRIFLNGFLFSGRWFIRKADLRAFMEATSGDPGYEQRRREEAKKQFDG